MAHTKGAKTCGCKMEPVSDDRDESDLCSDATEARNGVGWLIVYCPTHALAPEMADFILRFHDNLARAQRSGLTAKKDFSDWATVAFEAKSLLARLEGEK